MTKRNHTVAENTAQSGIAEVVIGNCVACGQIAELTRRTEDGLTDELDQFWLCHKCATPVIYQVEDGVPF